MRELKWTIHAKAKMGYYRLSQSRVRAVIKTPERIEVGIAEGTIALMQPNGRRKSEHEIWVMVRDLKGERRVISAWRYPGRTIKGEPLPEEILREFRAIIL